MTEAGVEVATREVTTAAEVADTTGVVGAEAGTLVTDPRTTLPEAAATSTEGACSSRHELTPTLAAIQVPMKSLPLLSSWIHPVSSRCFHISFSCACQV